MEPGEVEERRLPLAPARVRIPGVPRRVRGSGGAGATTRVEDALARVRVPVRPFAALLTSPRRLVSGVLSTLVRLTGRTQDPERVKAIGRRNPDFLRFGDEWKTTT